jgi:NAD(P)-dependent dehydrogenase (short-subunit alcohol dehydrogenase family)
MDINFLGHVAVTKALLPALLEDAGTAVAAGDRPAPRVVNIASSAGLIAAPALSAYCASKYALEAFSDSLRRESAQWGLRVAIVEPSFLRTAILDDMEGKARKTWAALPEGTRNRWGAAYADAAAAQSVRIARSAQPAQLGVDAVLSAVLEEIPAARYRAGTPGTYLLPYLAALPAWVADPILARANTMPLPAGAPGGKRA